MARTHHLTAVPTLVILSLLATPSSSRAEEKTSSGDAKITAKHFDTAVEILDELADNAPDWSWGRADCASVLVIGKGGFIVGGTGGRGFLSCKDASGQWSAPTVLDIGGGSAGFQIGGQKAEILMLFVGVDDLEEVVHATPVFQTTASATAGEAGIGISGGGNPEIESEVITVAKSKGLYAGAIAEGLVIDPDEEANTSIYGREVTVSELLIDRTVAVPDPAKGFVDALSRHAAAASE